MIAVVYVLTVATVGVMACKTDGPLYSGAPYGLVMANCNNGNIAEIGAWCANSETYTVDNCYDNDFWTAGASWHSIIYGIPGPNCKSGDVEISKEWCGWWGNEEKRTCHAVYSQVDYGCGCGAGPNSGCTLDGTLLYNDFTGRRRVEDNVQSTTTSSPPALAWLEAEVKQDPEMQAPEMLAHLEEQLQIEVPEERRPAVEQLLAKFTHQTTTSPTLAWLEAEVQNPEVPAKQRPAVEQLLAKLKLQATLENGAGSGTPEN